MQQTLLSDLPEGLLLVRNCALTTGEVKVVQVSRDDDSLVVRCMTSANGELGDDRTERIRVSHVAWNDEYFGITIYGGRWPFQRMWRY
ncbi:MAG: hypothetical protein ABL879_10755 [Devosia sp.]